MDGNGGGDGEHAPSARLLSIPKEGERILGPTRRPDGSLRKPIRIRAGYVPQDEVAIYQSKGTLMKKAQPEVPPGYDPVLDAKPKTKSAKRNERKKEKRQQKLFALAEFVEKELVNLRASLASSTDKGKNLDLEHAEVEISQEVPSGPSTVESMTSHMNSISISETPVVVSPSTDSVESPKPGSSGQELDKKIRALKKKVRLAEAQLQGELQNLKPEQLEKMKKLEAWLEELKILEERKGTMSNSSSVNS
ncbi:partner of Y14 and mago isoform X2 [Typha latifolia]|uniref:partner of Y14 and mago isoform X2 n=1 Tax=Typha latifolia TaxID=4733 RepID=UPI003C2D44ED